MKAVVSSVLLVVLGFLWTGGVHGFTASPRTTRTTTNTRLHVATVPGGGMDDWTGKPIPSTAKSTTPVAKTPVTKWQRMFMEDVVIDPDYFLSWSTFLLSFVIMWYHPSYMADGSPSLIGIFGGGFHIVFAALLWVQTVRVRCVFEKDAFEFYNVKGNKGNMDVKEGGATLVRKPANYVSGTRNRWSYDKITNYGFFPSLEYPVICYFKETETPKEQWNQWFAAFDSYQRGQPHFFPGLCNARQFKAEMEKRGVKSKPTPTPLKK